MTRCVPRSCHPIAALALVVALVAGAAGADPLAGSFKVEMGDGNRVYTFGQKRNTAPAEGENGKCGRTKGGLDGHSRARCTFYYDDDDVKGSLTGPVELSLYGYTPRRDFSVDLDVEGRLEIDGQSYRARLQYSGSKRFHDGVTQFKMKIDGQACLDDLCDPFDSKLEFHMLPDEGIWKLKVRVKEKEPGVLRGKAVARLFEDNVHYRVEGSYDAISGTGKLELIGRESPEQHSISIIPVRFQDGRVTGRLRFDLYGQIGGAEIDVPFKPRPITSD